MRDDGTMKARRSARERAVKRKESESRRGSASTSRRRPRARRSLGGRNRTISTPSHDLTPEFFRIVDAEALAEEEDAFGVPERARVGRASGDEDVCASLIGVFDDVSAETLRLMTVAKLRRRRSDPVSVVRLYARRSARRRRSELRRSEAKTESVGATPAAAVTVADDEVMVDAPSPTMEANVDDGAREGGGLYGLLLRAAADERAGVEKSLPSTHTLEEVRGDAMASDDLVTMSREFEREDARVGSLVRGLGGGVAHVLRNELGEALGYTLTYENRAPEWDETRAVTLPPRLAHVFIREEHRGRGLGTGLVARWVKTFALRCAFFAVDSPNESMARTLRRVNTALATTHSGHGASSVHYISLHAQS